MNNKTTDVITNICSWLLILAVSISLMIVLAACVIKFVQWML